MKASKVRRKQLNRMRQMSEVPWPARRFRVAPTFGVAGSDVEKIAKQRRRQERREHAWRRELEQRGQLVAERAERRSFGSRLRRVFRRQGRA